MNKLKITILILLPLFLAGCFGKPAVNQNQNTNQNLNTSEPTTQELSTYKLIISTFGTGEQGKEMKVYLVDPVVKEVAQMTQSPYQFSGLYEENLVFINKDTNTYYRYEPERKNYMSLNFPALKKEGNVYETLYINHAPISDGDKILISVFTYNMYDEVNEFFGDRPVRDRRDYLFSFSQNSFEEARSIEQARKLLSDNIGDFGGYKFLGLNENNQRAFFQLTGEGIGCSDIAVVNLINNTIQRIEDKNFQKGGSVGCFYVNPDLKVGFYVESKSGEIIAKLVSLSDITTPLYTFNLTNAVDKYGPITNPDIDSLEWLNDETRVLIGFTNRIAILDFKTNKLKTIYNDLTLGQSYLYWDRNIIKSDGQTYFAFVDYYSANYRECISGGKKTCPSSQTDDNRYRVVAQDLTDNSQEIFLDDIVNKKEVIGWVNW
ncbi:MAG: hypothetical protein A3J62_00890 [Candidatus Buchananbacteria bacterium RIFCSPHIGHO2_02_FULL_38_8]|uniref:Uncharacterized protein n=2 Tax=Candidatus Buchananiibacteriota TaxID=1817903 RepID=A0A1G1XX45_9BACT|nr:MAG: hypothetical protein A2731_00955 [Candidatus Buchananbacteria bacterium RIFCSPHIGHO2_01_FULL_39_8]OGY47751.1 MAG: hypothetical protein A3J62_00890 [Candidatus Buchananbacteria bacterium RIFCSPHIGHO2_02_FULL_38_8]